MSIPCLESIDHYFIECRERIRRQLSDPRRATTSDDRVQKLRANVQHIVNPLTRDITQTLPCLAFPIADIVSTADCANPRTVFHMPDVFPELQHVRRVNDVLPTNNPNSL
jgi:hypothetical protein